MVVLLFIMTCLSYDLSLSVNVDKRLLEEDHSISVNCYGLTSEAS